MRISHPFLISLTAFTLLLSACGLESNSNPNLQSLSEEEAMDVLMDTPLEAGGMSVRGRRSRVSAAELEELLIDLVESGELEATSSGRGAISSTADLGPLSQIFSLIQSGRANNIFSLTRGLLQANSGNANQTSGGLQGVLDIIQAAIPIISSIAPQFAPILSALTVIIPLVMSFIGLFG